MNIFYLKKHIAAIVLQKYYPELISVISFHETSARYKPVADS